MFNWLWAHSTAQNVGAVSGWLSAVAWLASALHSTEAYLGLVSTPERRGKDWVSIKRQAALNTVAATLSAISAACSDYALWWTG